MYQRFFYWLDLRLIALLAIRDILGLENLPANSPFIFALNHLSMFDVPLVFSIVGDKPVTGWVAEKYYKHILLGPMLKIGGGVFIRRGQVDRTAIADAVAWLNEGNVFGVAPEGTRSDTHALIRGKTGLAFLADEASVPVIPMAVTGTEMVFQHWLRLRRPVLSLRIGKPFHLPPLGSNNRSSSLRQNTDEIMCQIAAMLPPEYWGVYADHPRLAELLSSN
jgi:1-acyl-sn-glycerol-3-phosphate acyltransferase